MVWKKIRDLFESKLRLSNRCCDCKCMYFARDNRKREGGMIIRKKREIWREKKGKKDFKIFILFELKEFGGIMQIVMRNFFFLGENKNANLGEDLFWGGISRLFV